MTTTEKQRLLTEHVLRVKIWQDNLPQDVVAARVGDKLTAVVRLRIPRPRRWWHFSAGEVETLEHRVYFVVEGIE